jgi:hypothetical protein
MSGVYTNIARKRAEQNKSPVSSSYENQSDVLPPTKTKPIVHNQIIETYKEEDKIPRHKDNTTRLPERANAPTPARPNGRRIITRNSFETYEDQMETLRKLSFKEKMEGKVGSMSKMVRDAIDEYLEKRSTEL